MSDAYLLRTDPEFDTESWEGKSLLDEDLELIAEFAGLDAISEHSHSGDEDGSWFELDYGIDYFSTLREAALEVTEALDRLDEDEEEEEVEEEAEDDDDFEDGDDDETEIDEDDDVPLRDEDDEEEEEEDGALTLRQVARDVDHDVVEAAIAELDDLLAILESLREEDEEVVWSLEAP